MWKNESASHPVLEAIRSGRWRDPGPDVLRRVLGESLDLPDLELFSTSELMQVVKDQVESGGYIDDSEFCMVRSVFSNSSSDDRLVFDSAVFIAGSVDPGDDVFVVSEGNIVRVFDWQRSPPDRWVNVGSFESFVNAIMSGDG